VFTFGWPCLKNFAVCRFRLDRGSFLAQNARRDSGVLLATKGTAAGCPHTRYGTESNCGEMMASGAFIRLT
jgi:hypothetical protein